MLKVLSMHSAGRIGNTNDKKTRKSIKTVMANCYIGDWFVLYQISKNVNMYFFRAFMKELQYDLKPKSRNFEKKTSLPDYQSVAKVEEDTKSRVFLLPINVTCNRFFFFCKLIRYFNSYFIAMSSLPYGI